MTTTTLDRPVVHRCEIAQVMAHAHHRVFGHWRGDNSPHAPFCACPNAQDAPAVTLGAERGARLVVLLTKFAYRVHTDAEQTEMLALIEDAKG